MTMMKLPVDSDVQRLKDFNEPGCVTIYVPWMPANAATNPMRIMLKDLAKEAETKLKAERMPDETIQQTLKPLHHLINEVDAFWPHRHQGIALFLHANIHYMYDLPPDSAEPHIEVRRGFGLGRLLDALASNEQYALLVLDRHATQLYLGDRYQLTPAHLKGFPADMAHTLNIDEFPSWRELHAIAPAYMGKGSEGYHSQYNVAEVNKRMLLEFFRVIDHRLYHFLSTRQIPLVIAGVGYVLPLYRKANTYAKLWGAELHGNFRRSTLDTLRTRTWNALHTSGL